jgi:hypothetical protein
MTRELRKPILRWVPVIPLYPPLEKGELTFIYFSDRKRNVPSFLKRGKGRLLNNIS